MEKVESSNAVVRRPETRRLVWDPWSEFDDIRRHFDGLLGRMLGASPMGRPFALAETPLDLPVDLVETAEEFQLSAYLPGIRQEGIGLEVEPERVTLSAERAAPEQKEGAIVHLRGLAAGRLQSVVALPGEVVPEKATAAYRDGVLTVHLPKAEQARWRKPIRVAIQGNE